MASREICGRLLLAHAVASFPPMLAEPIIIFWFHLFPGTLGNSSLHRTIMVVSLTNLGDRFMDGHVYQFRSMRHCGRRALGGREMYAGSF